MKMVTVGDVSFFLLLIPGSGGDVIKMFVMGHWLNG